MDETTGGAPELQALEAVRIRCGLGRFEMWVRYFALGGLASPLELDACFNGSLVFTDAEYDVAVQALNERLVEIGSTSTLKFRSPGRRLSD